MRPQHNNKRFSFRDAGVAITIVLAAHAALLFSGTYGTFPDVDVFMHFGGGAAMGMLAIALHDASEVSRKVWWERPLFVAGFVALIAVLWEFHEFLLDAAFVENETWIRSQLSLADTIGDLFLGLVGAMTVYGLFGTKK